MKELKQMLRENTPFAVMQYFESFKSLKKETHKKYELIYINHRKEISYKLLDQNEIYFVKQNLDKIKLIIDYADGKIYEFNNFKEYKEANNIRH
jgi:vacuolar-type H+-ATPase subunit H